MIIYCWQRYWMSPRQIVLGKRSCQSQIRRIGKRKRMRKNIPHVAGCRAHIFLALSVAEFAHPLEKYEIRSNIHTELFRWYRHVQ